MTASSRSTLLYIKRQLIYYYHKNKVLPDTFWLVKQTGCTPEQVDAMIVFLKKKNFLIEREGCWVVNPDVYRIQTEEKEPEPVGFTPAEEAHAALAEPAPPLSELKKESQPERNQELPEITSQVEVALKIILLTIGAGAAFMSVYYSFKWFETLLNPFLAGLLAAVMVLYSVSSFELIILFLQKSQKLLAGIFAVLWVMVAGFSMVSTVAGQYSGNIKRIAETQKEKQAYHSNHQKVSTYKDLKSQYQKQIADLAAEETRLQILLINYKTPEQISENQKLYNTLSWQRNKANQDRRVFVARLEELEKDKPEELLKEAEADFYSWVGSIFKISAEKIQFWLSIFPALFIDIISPTSIAIAFFMNSNKSKD